MSILFAAQHTLGSPYSIKNNSCSENLKVNNKNLLKKIYINQTGFQIDVIFLIKILINTLKTFN